MPDPPVLHVEGFLHHVSFLTAEETKFWENMAKSGFPHRILVQTVRNTESLTSLISDQEAVAWEPHDLRLEPICLSTKFSVAVRLSRDSYYYPTSILTAAQSLSSQILPKGNSCEQDRSKFFPKEGTDT